MKKELSVIIPAYNEEENLAPTVISVVDYLTLKKYAFEVILVNDGSTDSTKARTLELVARYPEVKLIQFEKNQGKGKAVKAGVAAARRELCLFMDADNATTIQEWDKFETCFQQGAQAVVASRHLAASQIAHPQPWIRRFLGTGYRFLCRRWFGMRVSDFNCGFKAYRTPLAQKIYAQNVMDDWTFDAEVFCRMKKEKIPFVEVPVRWTHQQKKSEGLPFKTAFKTLGSLRRLKRLFP